MRIIEAYFPGLTVEQRERFEALDALYREWNEKINVISRKDMDNLYLHHVLHSMAIARIVTFRKDTQVMDVGTGGGFPGIPLAIMFPEVRFHLLDSIGKKIKVAEAVAEAIGLRNVSFAHRRVEDETRRFDFVVSRAVMPLPDLVRLVRKNIEGKGMNALPNGLICLKGGDLTAELASFRKTATVFNLADEFGEEFFETKRVVHVPL